MGTRQLNGQLFVALVGQFQGFSRALHDEALDWLRGRGSIGSVLAQTAARERQLDRANPGPSSLGNDFGRLGMQLTDLVKARSTQGGTRLRRLEAAVALRNGVAHDDETRVFAAEGAGAVPTLTSYRVHRRALERLAVDMDVAVAHHLSLLGAASPPW